MRYLTSALAAVFIFFVVSVTMKPCLAGEDHDVPPITGSKELQKLKSLEGKWQGTTVMDGKEMPFTVVYETSSNGSVVVETLFPDTPHEMVSVYYDDGGKLSMTHYCAVGNQPHLVLDKATDSVISLGFVSGSNIDPGKGGYMHDVSFDFEDNGTIVQKWTYFQDGRQSGVSTFTFARAQE